MLCGYPEAFVQGSGTAAAWVAAEGVRFDLRVGLVVPVLTWWTSLAMCIVSEEPRKFVISLVFLRTRSNDWPSRWMTLTFENYPGLPNAIFVARPNPVVAGDCFFDPAHGSADQDSY